MKTYEELMAGFAEPELLPYCASGIGAGWVPLVEPIITTIRQENEKRGDGKKIQVAQIKEKFGELRFYTNGSTADIAEQIEKAEQISRHTCEECGEIGTHRTDGWHRTLCDVHEAAYQARDSWRPPEE